MMALITKQKLNWSYFAKTPYDATCMHQDPILYHSPKDNKDYLLFIPSVGDSRIMYKYDIKDDKFIDWIKYPNEIDIINGAMVDSFENCLYLIVRNHFAKINLNNDKFEFIKYGLDILFRSTLADSICFVDNKIIHQIHLYDDGYHIKIDSKQQKLINSNCMY